MGIVASVMGFCKWAMGWGLGIAESIAAVIVIGFSVDYVVHLGHMYRLRVTIITIGTPGLTEIHLRFEMPTLIPIPMARNSWVD